MLGWIVFPVLIWLAGLHLYWGFGGRWPGHDAASLREMVVGTRGARMPGLGPTAAVACALIAAAVIVVLRHGRIHCGLEAWIVYGGYAVLILVFAVRGLLTYTTAIFDYSRETAFFRLNREIYSPLCLAIAAGLAFDYPYGLESVLQRPWC